jgi:hypothetical protein
VAALALFPSIMIENPIKDEAGLPRHEVDFPTCHFLHILARLCARIRAFL